MELENHIYEYFIYFDSNSYNYKKFLPAVSTANRGEKKIKVAE